MNVVLA